MRLTIVYGIIALVWIILLTRIYYLSIKSNEYYEQIAEKNAIKTEDIAPVRGQILDKNGQPLAVNKLGFEISIKPHLRRNLKVLDDEINFIISVFPDLNATKLKREYIKNDSPYSQDFVNVVNFLDYEIEVGLVLGKEITEEIIVNNDNLSQYVVGLVIVNDVSTLPILFVL